MAYKDIEKDFHIESKTNPKEMLKDCTRSVVTRRHIQRMPCITNANNQNMSVWTDVKEILFPSCTDKNCDIVLQELKIILNYPKSERYMHPCTPREHVAFLRQFRSVAIGTLLVQKDKLDTFKNRLWVNVLQKHSTIGGGENYCCLSETSLKSDVSSSQDVTSKSQNDGHILIKNNWLTFLKFSQTSIDQKIPTHDFIVPAYMKEDKETSRLIPYIPLCILCHHIPAIKKQSIELCGNHVVSSSNSTATRCCTINEGRQITRWLFKHHGWGHWRHLTSRDLLISWGGCVAYLKDVCNAIELCTATLNDNKGNGLCAGTVSGKQHEKAEKYMSSIQVNGIQLQVKELFTECHTKEYTELNKNQEESYGFSISQDKQPKKRLRMTSPQEGLISKDHKAAEENVKHLDKPSINGINSIVFRQLSKLSDQEDTINYSMSDRYNKSQLNNDKNINAGELFQSGHTLDENFDSGLKSIATLQTVHPKSEICYTMVSPEVNRIQGKQKSLDSMHVLKLICSKPFNKTVKYIKAIKNIDNDRNIPAYNNDDEEPGDEDLPKLCVPQRRTSRINTLPKYKALGRANLTKTLFLEQTMKDCKTAVVEENINQEDKVTTNEKSKDFFTVSAVGSRGKGNEICCSKKTENVIRVKNKHPKDQNLPGRNEDRNEEHTDRNMRSTSLTKLKGNEKRSKTNKARGNEKTTQNKASIERQSIELLNTERKIAFKSYFGGSIKNEEQDRHVEDRQQLLKISESNRTKNVISTTYSRSSKKTQLKSNVHKINAKFRTCNEDESRKFIKKGETKKILTSPDVIVTESSICNGSVKLVRSKSAPDVKSESNYYRFKCSSDTKLQKTKLRLNNIKLPVLQDGVRKMSNPENTFSDVKTKRYCTSTQIKGNVLESEQVLYMQTINPSHEKQTCMTFDESNKRICNKKERSGIESMATVRFEIKDNDKATEDLSATFCHLQETSEKKSSKEEENSGLIFSNISTLCELSNHKRQTCHPKKRWMRKYLTQMEKEHVSAREEDRLSEHLIHQSTYNIVTTERNSTRQHSNTNEEIGKVSYQGNVDCLAEPSCVEETFKSLRSQDSSLLTRDNCNNGETVNEVFLLQDVNIDHEEEVNDGYKTDSSGDICTPGNEENINQDKFTFDTVQSKEHCISNNKMDEIIDFYDKTVIKNENKFKHTQAMIDFCYQTQRDEGCINNVEIHCCNRQKKNANLAYVSDVDENTNILKETSNTSSVGFNDAENCEDYNNTARTSSACVNDAKNDQDDGNSARTSSICVKDATNDQDHGEMKNICSVCANDTARSQYDKSYIDCIHETSIAQDLIKKDNIGHNRVNDRTTDQDNPYQEKNKSENHHSLQKLASENSKVTEGGEGKDEHLPVDKMNVILHQNQKPGSTRKKKKTKHSKFVRASKVTSVTPTGHTKEQNAKNIRLQNVIQEQKRIFEIITSSKLSESKTTNNSLKNTVSEIDPKSNNHREIRSTAMPQVLESYRQTNGAKTRGHDELNTETDKEKQSTNPLLSNSNICDNYIECDNENFESKQRSVNNAHVNKNMNINFSKLRFEMAFDASGTTTGGLVIHPQCVIPYVLVNGFKFVTIMDVVQFFPNCNKKCPIPKTVLRKEPGLHRTFCTWEQVYVLDLIYSAKGRRVKTGDLIIRMDSFLDRYEQILHGIKEKHAERITRSACECSY